MGDAYKTYVFAFYLSQNKLIHSVTPQDIRNLITDWAEEIDECERICIRASVSNRRIFLDYEGAIIQKGDDRLRTFPFPTRRPVR